MPNVTPPAATVARALLASLVRHTLTMAGAALVTRGLVDQGTVDGYMATAVEMIVGALMAGGALAWGQFRAYLSHTRWKRAWDVLRIDEPTFSPPNQPNAEPCASSTAQSSRM